MSRRRGHPVIRPVGFTSLGPVSGSSVFAAGGPVPPCGFRQGDFEIVPDFYATERRYKGWSTALSRLREHCKLLGADGVIGVHLSRTRLGRRVEYTASGTAVRALGETHPVRPFTALVDDREFVALLSAGWVPVGVAIGVGAVRSHLGLVISRQGEQAEHTELLTHARSAARQAFHDDAHRQHADDAVFHRMITGMETGECGTSEARSDLEADALIIGTALAHFRPAPRPPLTIMPLHRGVTG